VQREQNHEEAVQSIVVWGTGYPVLYEPELNRKDSWPHDLFVDRPVIGICNTSSVFQK
jgi:hypothetical protein